MKSTWFIFVVISFCLFQSSFVSSIRLLAIQDGRVHILRNQHDGTFLSAPKTDGNEGTALKLRTTEENKDKYAGQRFIFNAQGKDTYAISPVTEGDQPSQSVGKFELIRAGHGKRLIKNVATQLCLSNSGRASPVSERKCNENDGKQRWYIEPRNT